MTTPAKPEPTPLAPAVEKRTPTLDNAAPDETPPTDAVTQPEFSVGPAIKPVVIGEGVVVAERKRGWWRR
jgi:hypothetical protein